MLCGDKRHTNQSANISRLAVSTIGSSPFLTQIKGKQMTHCKSFGCTEPVIPPHIDFCHVCAQKRIDLASDKAREHAEASSQSLSEKYPKHYKPIGDLTDVDVYAVHYLFNIQDPSGCIQQASRKLLLSSTGASTKSVHHTIEEARDLLTRWLELNSSMPI